MLNVVFSILDENIYIIKFKKKNPESIYHP